VEEKESSQDPEYTDTSNVLGLEGRFGTSGDFAKPAKDLKIER